jgi:hypothetical protein
VDQEAVKELKQITSFEITNLSISQQEIYCGKKSKREAHLLRS